MRFDVKFSAPNTPITLKPLRNVMRVTFEQFQMVTEAPDVDFYTGAYTFTPAIDPQTVPTARKYLTENVQIKAIPIYSTSNVSGGNTVYIASEVH